MAAPLPTKHVVLAVAGAFFAVGAVFVTPVLGDFGGDSAQYLALAESLARGGGYVDAHLPGRPLHVHYPPGLPLLLAPVAWCFGDGAFVPAKLLLLACTALGLVAAGRFLLARAPAWQGLGGLGVAAASTALLVQAVRIQSGSPLLLLSFLTLWQLERPRPGRSSWGYALGFATLGFAMRVAGVVLLLTVAAVALRRLRLRGLRVAALAALPVLVFWGYTRLAGGGTWSYEAELAAATGGIGGFLAHAGRGLWFYVEAAGALAVNVPLVGTSPAASAACALPVVVGLGRRLAAPRAGELFFLLTLLVAAAAPMHALRYLVPVAPLVGFYFVTGIATILAVPARLLRAGPTSRLPRVAGIAAALVVVFEMQAVGGVLRARLHDRPVDPPPLLRRDLPSVHINLWEEGWFLGRDPYSGRVARAYGDFLLLLAALRDRLPRKAILAARKPRLVAYLSRRPCVALPDEMHGAALRTALAAHRVTHVVADGLFASTRRILGATRDSLRLVPFLELRSSACLALPAAAGPDGGG